MPAAAEPSPDQTIAHLRRTLQRHLPAPFLDVMLTMVQWRSSRKRVTALIPNRIWLDLFCEHCQALLEQTLDEQGRQLVTVCQQEVVAQHDARGQTMDSFLADPGNEFAIRACRQVIAAPGAQHNPLYLHGPAGCGKSHLLAAVTAALQPMIDRDQILHLDGPTWVSHQAQELADHGPGPLRQAIEKAIIITFDEVDSCAQRPLAQEQLFHLINNAIEWGQQLIIAGRQAPRQLPATEERLISRLGWGLVAQIEVPMLETRLAFLRQLAPTIVEDLDHDELVRMVDTLAPDMRHVVRLSNRLLEGEQVGGGEVASFDRVLECVARHYGLRPGDIAGKRRSRPVAQARQAALMLARRLTSYSLEALGGMIGGRDHSTVLYSIRQAEERCSKDPAFAQEIGQLSQEILLDG